MRKPNILECNSQDTEMSQDGNTDDQKIQKNPKISNQTISIIKKRFQDFLEQIKNLKYQPLCLDLYNCEFSDEKTKKTIGLEDINIILQNSIRKITTNRREKKNWAKDDFILLLWIIEKYNQFNQKIVEEYTEEDWKKISLLVPGKDHHQCMFKWLGLKRNKFCEKFPWTETEEILLKSLVKQQHSNKWFQVSKQLYLENKGFRVYRSPKQCRERWACYLNPNLKKGPWVPEQDIILLKKYLDIGKKWSNIAKILNGRTENAVKNRFNLILEKKEKNKFKLSDDEYIRYHIQNLEINNFMKTENDYTSSFFKDERYRIDNSESISKKEILIQKKESQSSQNAQTQSNLSEIGYESDTCEEQKNTHFITFKNLNIKELMDLCQKLLPAEFDEENDEINYKPIAPIVKIQKKDYEENFNNGKYVESPSTNIQEDLTFHNFNFQDQNIQNQFYNP